MQGQTKNYRSFVLQSLLVVVITLLLLEAVGLVVHFHKHGSIYYMDAGETGAAVSQDSAPDSALETRNILHPYLGFTFRPSLPMSRVADRKRIRELLGGSEAEPSWANLSTNNHGFFSEYDYPRARENERELVIGIFGGSVAQWFALQGAEQLEKKLQEHASFRGREITVVNYSQGGFKQPQQLQALGYFLSLGQKFDVVVNVDGFNEIALSMFNHKNGIDTSMPSAQHLLPLLGLMGGGKAEAAVIDKLHDLNMSERKLRRIERWESSAKSAGLHMILAVLVDRARSDYAREVRAIDALGSSFERTSLVYLADYPDTIPVSDSLGNAIDYWVGAAVTMQEICDATGILYLEVIQPNQYYSRKEFSGQEREIAINMDSPYREAIESGYQHLPDIVHRMQQAGVNVISAASLFDAVREPIYSDSCCHYNQAGNEILASKVAESIISLFEERQNMNPVRQGETVPAPRGPQ